MSDQPILNPQLRTVLEDFGVIKAPRVPSLDKLCKAVKERGGAVDLAIDETITTAKVSLSGNAFDAAADNAALAVAVAFSMALLAQPRQAELFDGDQALTDEQRASLERLRDQLRDGREGEA